MMFSEFCETTGLHGWKYLAKVKYQLNVATTTKDHLNWKKLSNKNVQVQTGDRWYYKVRNTLDKDRGARVINNKNQDGIKSCGDISPES